jgi:hypothetical protein
VTRTTKLRLSIETFAVFLCFLPVLSIVLKYVQRGEGMLGLFGYPLVCPGWYLALWVYGYNSSPSPASNMFIVVVNALLYSAVVGWILFLLAVAQSDSKQ